MSRILVLLPISLWFVWADARGAPHPVEPSAVVLFLAGMALIVLLVAYAAVRQARRERRHQERRWLNYRMLSAAAQPATVGWFAYGLFSLGWGDAVVAVADFPRLPPLALPSALLATGPVYLTWALLLLAEYPMVRRRRESRLLADLDAGRPIYPPPPLLRYWIFSLRQRLLFALAPLAVVLGVRDGAMLGLWAAGVPTTTGVEVMLFLLSVLVVVAVSPELLRRLLPTRPLPPGVLRDRLEALCTRTRMQMRDILVWDTQGAMVNAAVVGFLPRMRYVLLSDLMLESMTPTQIEAVFAHEVGHVKHGHLLWYLAFLAGMTLFLAGPVESAARIVDVGQWLERLPAALAQYGPSVIATGLVLLLFGVLSRCFERQADVFAARTMQAALSPLPALQTARPWQVAVGAEGASAFASSLRVAAHLNYLPVDGRRRPVGPMGLLQWLLDQMTHFLHGTIRSRIDYLLHLSASPTGTRRFDTTMAGVKLAVLSLIVGSGTFLLFTA